MSAPPHWNDACNPDHRPLPDGWVTRYDEGYRAWYYVDKGAVPPYSSWTHPLGPPFPSPSPSPATYAPASNSPQNHGYGDIGGSPPYNQQQGQSYSEQRLNEFQSYRNSTEQLPMWPSDLTSGGNSVSQRGIDPQEPRAYLQKGFPSQQGYAGPHPGDYENLGWQQGWQQPQQVYAAQSPPHAIQVPGRGGRSNMGNAPAGGGVFSTDALFTELPTAFQSLDTTHQHNEVGRPYDQEDQEYLHAGISSMPRASAQHGHGSLPHRHALDSTNLINMNRPSREIPLVTAERSSQATTAQPLISRMHAHSPTHPRKQPLNRAGACSGERRGQHDSARESHQLLFIADQVVSPPSAGINCGTCGLNVPHLEALKEHFKESHVANSRSQLVPSQSYPLSYSPPSNPVLDSYIPHSAQVRWPQEQHQQPQPRRQRLTISDLLRDEDFDAPYESLPLAAAIGEVRPRQYHQGPQPQHRRTDDKDLYPDNYSAPPANPIFDSYIPHSTQVYRPQPQPQVQPQDHQHPQQQHQHPDDSELHLLNPELRHYSMSARDIGLQVDANNRQAAIKTFPNQSEFESRKRAAHTFRTMSPGAFWGRPGDNFLANAAVGTPVTKGQSEGELDYFLGTSTNASEAQVRQPQEQHQQHQPRLQPHHQRPQQQGQHPGDMELDMDSFPASSFPSSPLIPVITPLVHNSTQPAFPMAFSNVSLSQTSSDYGTIASPLQASQEVASASSSQPGGPYSPSFLTPSDSLSSSHVVSPVVAQGQRQASYHLPAQASRSTSSLLLSEPFRRPNPEDLEAPQALLTKKGDVVDGNDHTYTRVEIMEGDFHEEPETERPLCLFICDCQGQYKNINDLRYHYQHSGDHGAIGLQLLASGEHECLQHPKSSAATCQLTLAHSAKMSRSSPLPGESAGTQPLHYSQVPGQPRYSPGEVVNTPHSTTQEHTPAPPDPLLSDHLNATNNQTSSTQHHVPVLLSTSPRIVKPPDKLDPTLSCWISNMKKLTRLIDRLHELASSARAEYRTQLLNNVMALRAMSKKQEERFMTFLQSSDEYAIKYLNDISAEIQQDRVFLDKLEGRVEAAKKFCGEAVDLKTRYELGTVAAMKDLRAKTISRPLPEDQALFDEVDSVLTEIWKCYEELERFWSEEIRCATEAYEKRRVDSKDIERWKGHRASLKQTIDSWENEQPSDDSQTLCCNNACSSEGADKPDIGVIASSMSSAMGSLTSTLDRLHSSKSVQYSQSDLQPVYVSFEANRNMFRSLLQQFVDYGEKVFAFCLPSIASSTSSRAGAPQDLWELIMRLRSEMTDISPEKAASVQGSFWFKRKYKKALCLEQKLISGMNTLLEKWASVTDGHDLPGDALLDLPVLEHLREQWEEAERSMSANLADLKNGHHSAPLASTEPPSRMKGMKRWPMNRFGRNCLRVC